MHLSRGVEKPSGRVTYIVVLEGLCRFSVLELSKRGMYHTARISSLEMTKAGQFSINYYYYYFYTDVGVTSSIKCWNVKAFPQFIEFFLQYLICLIFPPLISEMLAIYKMKCMLACFTFNI